MAVARCWWKRLRIVGIPEIFEVEGGIFLPVIASAKDSPSSSYPGCRQLLADIADQRIALRRPSHGQVLLEMFVFAMVKVCRDRSLRSS